MAARCVTRIVLAALVVTLSVAAPAQAGTWVVTNLQSCCTLNGSPFSGAFNAAAINDGGDIVGSAISGGGTRGFALRNGQFKILNYLPAVPPHGSYGAGRPVPFSRAHDINNNGVIVGTSSVGLVGRGPSRGQHGAVWRPFAAGNSLEAFDLGAFQYNSESSGFTRPCNFVTQFPPDTGSGVLDCSGDGRAINNTDDVAGDSEFEVPGFGWPRLPWKIPGGNRKLIDVGEGAVSAPDGLHFPSPPSGASYRTAAINDSGSVVVVPNPATPTVASSSAVFTGLGSVGVPFAAAPSNSINNAGWVVGTGGAGTVADPLRGKIWQGGPVTTLPPLAGYRWSSANAINDEGDVVGKSWYAVDSGNFCEVATLWKHTDYTTPIDLGALEGVTGVKLYSAHAISNRGQILADGIAAATCPNGVNLKPFVLTPPSALKIADATATEPEAGTVDMTFDVTLDVAASEQVTVDYETQDGTGAHAATAGEDYTAKQGTLTFAPGDRLEQIKVPIKANGFQIDRTFTVKLSNPTGTEIDDDTATGTIRGRGPLEITIKPDKEGVDVKQNAQGPIVEDVVFDVAIKNRGKVPITTVTVPDKLTIGWDGAAPAQGFPITQTAPAPEDRTFGPIAPGETRHAKYTLHFSADGKYVFDVLVTGDAAGQTVKGFGTTKLKSDTQVIVYTGEAGAKVRSQKNGALIKAGTQWLVNVTLENRSYHRSILIEPIYPKLSGNASDGHLQLRDAAPTAASPTGNPDEVQPSKYVLLPPGQKRELVSVIRTGASDAFEDQGEGEGGVGGTRSSASFATPKILEVNEAGDDVTELPADRVSMTPGSTEFSHGVDDSHPDPPPFGYDAIWYAGKGSVFSLWRMTWGTARGLLWDLPTGVFFGVIDVSMGTLNAIDRTVALWTALESDPVAKAQYINAVADKVATVFEEAPAKLVLAPNTLFNTVSAAVGNSMTRSSKHWAAGDWRPVLTENVAGTGELAATVALSLGPGVLARFPAAASRWQALKAASYSKVSARLNGVVRRVTAARTAARALQAVEPGFEFTVTQMAKLYGVSAAEARRLLAYTRTHGISIVLRSRAQESIKFLNRGLAVVKPYWIKAKNVNEIDHLYLGYRKADVGKVVMRSKLPRKKDVVAALKKAGVKEGDVLYKEVLDRLKTRLKEQRGELREMRKWDKDGKVKGKWPWEDNGVDPRVQADEVKSYKFRLARHPDPKKGPDYLPKVYVPGEGWRFITGDIDLIALTRANGSALTTVEHVAHLKALKTLLGTQHPESATWVNKGKFWFNAKRNYLTNDGQCCLAQFGPDGKIRAVKFNEKLSEPEKWTKLRYRIYWDGAYQAGLGQ